MDYSVHYFEAGQTHVCLGKQCRCVISAPGLCMAVYFWLLKGCCVLPCIIPPPHPLLPEQGASRIRKHHFLFPCSSPTCCFCAPIRTMPLPSPCLDVLPPHPVIKAQEILAHSGDWLRGCVSWMDLFFSPLQPVSGQCQQWARGSLCHCFKLQPHPVIPGHIRPHCRCLEPPVPASLL